ncbi:zinc finger matrin-type protein 3 [Ambystoma mexicanum]|uniref:zinc finger matrin-type protein 3 n=1 Tax=Ambystoma mexicanum TaxID=8296 RepID=UPI0037E90456
MIAQRHENPSFHAEQPTIPASVSVATPSTAILPLSPKKLCEPPQREFGENILECTHDTELSKEPEQGLELGDLCQPLTCTLCKVTLNSAQQASAHYQGKHHGRKRHNCCAANSLVSFKLHPSVESFLEAVATGPSPLMSSTKHGGSVIMATENDYCKLCDASFSSPVVAQSHYQGKNHTKRLRSAEAQSHSFSDSSERRVRKEGHKYKVLQNRRNASHIYNNSAPYLSPCTRQQIPRDLAMCVTPSGQFYCSMCNAGASEEAEFRQHLESKPHKSNVSEQRYRTEMENLGYM